MEGGEPRVPKVNMACNFEHNELTVNELPVSIILKIFSYMSYYDLNFTVSFVCKHWLKLARDPILYQSLSFTGELSESQLLSINNKISDSPLLKSINLKRITNVSTIVQQISGSCPNLRKLKIGYCTKDLTTSDMKAIVYGCPDIEILKIRDCELQSPDILTNLQKLRVLDLTSFHRVDNTFLYLFADKCKHLEKIVLGGITLQDEDLVYLIQNLNSTLTKLVFSGEGLTDESYKYLASCTKLKALGIVHAENLTENGLQSIATLPNLVSLHIDKAFSVVESAMMFFFQHGYFNKLSRIAFYNSTCFTDNVIKIIADRYCKLERLVLSNCKHLTDGGIEYLLDKCKDLKHLSLYGLPNISTECLTGLPQSHPFIKSLHVALCPLVNFSELALLRQELRNLQDENDY